MLLALVAGAELGGLVDTYRNLRDQPLDVIKAAIYDHNYGEK